MAERPSLDLDLLIDAHGDGYRARVLRSPAGDGQAVTFARPFSELELENFLLKMGKARGLTRRVESAPVAAAKQFGGRLFSAVFSGPVGECLRRSVDRAGDEDATLRIRLRLADCPELAGIPWEFLYDRDDDWFVALSGATPVVRYLQLPAQPRPLRVTLPLRVLSIRSEPSDYPGLNLEAEWSGVMAALGEFAGEISVTDLIAPTLSELRRVLLRERFHVLHYMGHGGFTPERGGVLLFTGQDGRGVPVTGEQLSVMLRDHTSLRLAVLNACEAGRSDPADPFGGIADTLVRRGIPAVIAMQFDISDLAAIEFTPALYGALAAGRPVDVAVSEARKAVYAVSSLEWATPVLHLRADNAHLFEIAGRPPEPGPGPDPGPPGGARGGQPATGSAGAAGAAGAVLLDPPPADREGAASLALLGRSLIDQKRYQEAETALLEAVRLDPGHALAHGDLGHLRVEQRRYAEAEASLRKALVLDPASARAQTSLGRALFGLERYLKAETAFREALRIDPKRALAYNGLGAVLSVLRRPLEAEAAFREAIRLAPGDARPHGNLGVVLLQLKRRSEAVSALREAVRLDPGDARARNNLGVAFRDSGEAEQAEAEFQRALRLDPECEIARTNLAALGRRKPGGDAEGGPSFGITRF